jgi:hypothetical protein
MICLPVRRFREVDTDKSGFITFDELQHIIRVRLRVKPSVVTDSSLKSLWVLLDSDDNNRITPDEMKRFLNRDQSRNAKSRSKGPSPATKPAWRGSGSPTLMPDSVRSASPLLSRSPSPIQNGSGTSPRRLSPEERELARRKAEREAEAPARAVELRQMAVRNAERASQAHERRAAEELVRDVNMNSARLATEYKSKLLRRMRTSMIKSPIPAQDRRISAAGTRLGGQRILPLYESERLLSHMEQNGFRKPWPGARPPSRSPHSITSSFVDDISRVEYSLPRVQTPARFSSRPNTSEGYVRPLARPASCSGLPSRLSLGGSTPSRPGSYKPFSPAAPYSSRRYEAARALAMRAGIGDAD